MKVSEEFIKAKKDKELRSIGVFQRMERKSYENNEMELKTYIRLEIERSNNYNYDKQHISVVTDTEIKVDNYSYSFFKENDGSSKNVEVTRIAFVDLVYTFQDPCHIKTFLSAIKKDSDVSFQVVAYNGSENTRSVNWVSHQMYGIVDNKKFMLFSYTGPNNSASPVN